VIRLNKYKISIIIPTFNLEDKIKRAFDSIKKQTFGFENIEVIFVDDNSTDNTFNILTDISEEYKNVSVYKTDENSKYAGKPRNIGLDHATAEYVMFLDGDDELLIDSCKTLYNSIASTAIDVAIGGQINVFDGIHQHNPPLLYGNGKLFKEKKNLKVLKNPPAITAKLFKRKLLTDNNIRFPEGIAGQDLVFIMEVLLNSRKIITLNNTYIYYRILSDSSISFDISETYLKGLIKAYTLVCELYDKFEVPLDVQAKAIFQHIRFFTSQTIRTNVASNKSMLHNLFNSDLFKNLANKNVFKNNKYYAQYFNNMANGQYDNFYLLNNISHKFIKENEKDLKLANERLYDENLTLDKNYKSVYLANRDLNKRNDKLTQINHELAEKYNSINSKNQELENNISALKEELEYLKFKYAILKDENIYLKNDNIKLSKKE